MMSGRLTRHVKPAVRSSLRADIQGLRAFAVLVVISDHLFHWPRGGFVGVDIFFVISGFVITQSMLREHDRTGHISIANFYKRRVKRIMPAAALTLALTLAVGYFAFGAARFASLLWDAAFSAIFAANWRFATVGTDYFAAAGPVSPIQHFWSLAVEEQFYFAWPFLVAGIFALAARSGRRAAGARGFIGVSIAAISLASFLWALMETSTAPTNAYFSTLSRTWELGIGALLAVAAPACSRILPKARPVLAWTGVSGMVASLFLINNSVPFPAPTALLPVLSAALFTAAGSGVSQQSFLFPLTNPVSGYIGNMSYSLYLWHFPIIILAGVWLDTTDLGVQLGILVGIFVWSYYAYELWEKRILDSNWLKGSKRRTSSRSDTVFNEAYKLKALSLLVVLFLVVIYMGFRPEPERTAIASTDQTLAAPEATALPSDAPLPPETAKLQVKIKAALSTTSWPTLDPSMDEVIAADKYPEKLKECGSGDRVDWSTCTYGDSNAPKSAVLLGDSIAMHWVVPLRQIYGTGDWNFRSMAMFSCAFTDLKQKIANASRAPLCDQRKQEAVSFVNERQPDLVIVSSSAVTGYSPETNEAYSPAAWVAGAERQIKKLSGAKHVLILSAPPADKDVKECFTPTSNPAACVSGKTMEWSNVASLESKLAKELGGTHVDASSLFCFGGRCPSFVSGMPVKRDKVHITPEYGEMIVPALRELMLR
jgi:peptidoglycan/LPS O-acetylase OafA/YrhL